MTSRPWFGPLGKLLPRAFFERPPTEVAPELLGKILAVSCSDRTEDLRAGRLVEVEAYDGPTDPASHAASGETQRNRVMFGRGGHLYVYFTYGMHWCANAVCEPEGHGAGVLFRALAPLEGIEAMREARPAARSDRDLTSGPAKLAQALSIDGAADGFDLCSSKSSVVLLDDGFIPESVEISPRIGISKATERPWRWFVSGDPNVSRTPKRRAR